MMHWAQLSSEPKDGGSLVSDCADRRDAAHQYALRLLDEAGERSGRIRIWEEGTLAADGSEFTFEFSAADELVLDEVN